MIEGWWQPSEESVVKLFVRYPTPLLGVDGKMMDMHTFVQRTPPKNFWVTVDYHFEGWEDYSNDNFMFGMDFPSAGEKNGLDYLHIYYEYEKPWPPVRYDPDEIRSKTVRYNPQWTKNDPRRLIYEIIRENLSFSCDESTPRSWSKLAGGIRDVSRYLLSGLEIFTQEPQLPSPTVVDGKIIRHSAKLQR